MKSQVLIDAIVRRTTVLIARGKSPMRLRGAFGRAALTSTLLIACACQPDLPQTGSQTNWLEACDTSDDCGALKCICGTCTINCRESATCSELDAGACADAMDAGVIALCDGEPSEASMCVVRCDEASCPEGTSCVAGVCEPSREPSARVSIDPTVRHQTLLGFGASVAYVEDLIVGHPNKARLFDVMFAESGLEFIRMHNRFDGDNQDDLLSASEIVVAATERHGRDPIVFLTSGSPPDRLKANGDRYCSNADPDCTLVRNSEGEFDYAAFAEHWRASLEAYADAGIDPDFVSIQNNADWIPQDETAIEACRFLPQEGAVTVTTPDGDVIAEFPGYDQALREVQVAASTLGTSYALAAPEVANPIMVERYIDVLSASSYHALTLHLYGVDPEEIPEDQFESLSVLSTESAKPVIQSEMASDGFGTAVLAHYTLTLANGSAYLQQPFVSEEMDETSSALIRVEGEAIQTRSPYHALAHYARTTDPGWRRVEASSDTSDVLSSAWISPDETSLTVVLLNPTAMAIDVEVAMEGALVNLLEDAGVMRTVFDGVERSADLGTLPKDRVLRIPRRSIVTVVTDE